MLEEAFAALRVEALPVGDDAPKQLFLRVALPGRRVTDRDAGLGDRQRFALSMDPGQHHLALGRLSGEPLQLGGVAGPCCAAQQLDGLGRQGICECQSRLDCAL